MKLILEPHLAGASGDMLLAALLAETTASGHPHDGGTPGHRLSHPHVHAACHGHSRETSHGKE